MSVIPLQQTFLKSKISTRFMFFSAGFITASWAALIPVIKTATGSDDGTIGLLLLCLGTGAITGMPLAGMCATRFGCKRVLMCSVTGFSLLFPALIMAHSTASIAVLLLIFGLFIGITDCTMNIQALMIEQQSDTPLMSGFHGFYSLGGMSGAIALTTLLVTGIPVLISCMIISAFMLCGLFLSKGGLSKDVSSGGGPYFVLPEGPVILISFVCFVIFLAEGTVLDWSGIFLSEYRSVSSTSTGIGIACFSVAMTAARLFGDKAVSFFGAEKMVNAGALTAIAGFVLTLSLDYTLAALCGYILIGAGCANIIPVMFSACGKQSVMPASLAVTATSTLGYFGVLAGPALIGFTAELFTLPAALYSVAVLIFIALLVSLKIQK